jgi:hypothetical protein
VDPKARPLIDRLLASAADDTDAGVRAEACGSVKRFVRSCAGGARSPLVRALQPALIKALGPMTAKGSGMAMDKLQAERALMYALDVVSGYDVAVVSERVWGGGGGDHFDWLVCLLCLLCMLVCLLWRCFAFGGACPACLVNR